MSDDVIYSTNILKRSGLFKGLSSQAKTCASLDKEIVSQYKGWQRGGRPVGMKYLPTGGCSIRRGGTPPRRRGRPG